MQTFRAIVRRANGDGTQTEIWQGEIKASRGQVAFQKAAAKIPDRPEKEKWFHVSICRIKTSQ